MSSYEKLRSDNSDFSIESQDILVEPSKARRQRWVDVFIILAPTAAFIIGLLTLLSVTQITDSIQKLASRPAPHITLRPTHRQDPGEVPHNCGSSRAEALAKGCIFNIMANAWLPLQCYDAEAAQKWVSPDNDLVEFDGAGVFDWWQDKNHTMPIAQEKLNELDEAHTVQAYHVAHCLYDWEATVKALKRVVGGESPVWVHSKLLEQHHVHHCLVVIAAQKHFYQFEWASVAKVTFGYGACVRLDAMSKIEAVFDK